MASGDTAFLVQALSIALSVVALVLSAMAIGRSPLPGTPGAAGPAGANGTDGTVPADLTVSTLNVTTCLATPLRLPSGEGADYSYDCDVPTSGYNDLSGDVVVRFTGPTSPSFNVFKNAMRAYEFVGTGTAVRELQVNYHIPHTYKPGTGIFFHVHWSPSAAAPAGNITWHFEYMVGKAFGDPFSNATTVTVTTTMPAQYVHKITEIPTAVLDSGAIEVGSLVLLRLYRDAGAATDTSTDSAFVFYVDVHFVAWKFGTLDRHGPMLYVGSVDGTGGTGNG